MLAARTHADLAPLTADLPAATAPEVLELPDSGGLHIVVRGRLQASSLKVRYQRRFLRWRW